MRWNIPEFHQNVEKAAMVMRDPASPTPHASRLVRVLSEFHPTGAAVTGGQFADRFGRLLGLRGAVMLSKAQEELAAVALKPAPVDTSVRIQELRQAFLEVRGELLKEIALSFVPVRGITGSNRLPSAARLHAHFQLTRVYAAKCPGSTGIHAIAFEPYRKFYMSHQRAFEIRIRQLRSRVGGGMARISSRLDRLSRLDASFASALSGLSFDFFSVIPTLLERRFGEELDAHRKPLPGTPVADDVARWMAPGGWIGRFCEKLKVLLLAELDMRLQPVLGMIESLPEASSSEPLSDGGSNAQ